MTLQDLIDELQRLPDSAKSAEVTVAYFNDVVAEEVADTIARVKYERGEVQIVAEGVDDE